MDTVEQEMKNEKQTLMASDISISEVVEQETNKIFLLVRMRMLSTRPNGNNQCVTEAFVNEIVSNSMQYSGLPLYVDEPKLLARQYRSLGHMLDPRTGKFGTTQIGSLCAFDKVADEYGTSLYGEARIPKREEEVCQRIMELYQMGMLNFSFEIVCSRDELIEKDGIEYIDASPNNALTGMAVVSVPAYEEATALSQVAQKDDDKKCGGNVIENGMDDRGRDRDDDDRYDDDRDDRHDPDDRYDDRDDPDDRYDDDRDDHDDMDDDEWERRHRNERGVGTMTLEEATKLLSEKEQKIGELSEALDTANALAETEKTDKEKALTDLSAANDELKNKDECIASNNAAIAEKDAHIAELEAKVSELEQIRAEYDQIKAEKAAAELAEKQSRAKAFAQRQGLDVEKEEVAKAIAELNYEAIASLSMDIAKDADEKQVRVAGFVGGNMKIDDKYGDLLSSVKH